MAHPKDLPNLLEEKETLTEIISRRPPLLFLDFDGTLSPIVEDRHAAAIDPKIKDSLKKLVNVIPLLAVISGRDLRDVREKVGIDGIYYMGSHGFETSGPAELESQQPEALKVMHQLDKAEQLADEALQDKPGIEVERKRFAIAIHFRKAGQEAGKLVRETVSRIVRNNESLQQTTGKMIEEIRPNIEWDKGKALLWLCEELEFDLEDNYPMYLGDDITDEDAYREIRDLGAGVQVGEHGQETLAKFSLDSIDQVAEFLEWLYKFQFTQRSPGS